MASIVYLSHPQVAVDPDLAVEAWSLSALGQSRLAVMLAQPWLADVRRVVSSTERKAIEAAEVVAGHLGIDVEIRDGVGEMDRSATGFLPPEEFEAVADEFFAAPDRRARGWERAIDAQRRVAGRLADLLSSAVDVAVVGHGGVGTLWWCHLSAVPIDRRWDQPGQGNYFTVDTATGRPRHHWRPIDLLDDRVR